MNPFSKMLIRHKLFLLILPLLLTLLFFVINFNLYLGKTVDANRDIDSLVRLSIASSALVHEIQKERGLTAGFLGKSGSKFRDKLLAQRNLTDSALSSWNAFLQQNQGSIVQSVVVDSISKIRLDLEKLSSNRSSILSRDMSTGDALKYYSGINSKLLSESSIIASVAEDGLIARELVAYEQFLQGKERGLSVLY